MATTGTNGQSAGVLLVDANTLLLQGDNEDDSSDVTADLLHQALHGATTVNAPDNTSQDVGEVKFDSLSDNSNHVVAIFQGDSGETHTIKMTHEQLESLGLHLENKDPNSDVSASSNGVVNNVTTATPNPAGNLMTTAGGILPMDQDSLLPPLPNMISEGRIIDEEGNIVQADNMNILPTSLNSFMEQDVGQAITIVPQYGVDGSLTYAVKLDDRNDLTSSNFTLTTDAMPKEEHEPKTGLDIEVEMARVNAKRTLSSLEEAMGPVAIPISSSGSVPISTAISLPTLPLTATIPRVTNSNKFVSVMPSSAPTPAQNSFFRILPDRSAMNIGAIASPVQSSGNIQPLQTNLTNIVSNPIVHPVVSKLQSSIGFPLTASTINTTLASARSLNVSSSSPLGLNVFSIMNSNNAAPATSATTFRTIASNSVSLKHPLRPAPPRISNIQTTTSRLLPITSTKVTGVNVLPSPPAALMTSAASTQPAIAAAAITKVCQPISAAGSRAPNQLNTKPLGSSENPIQLVQQGQTFHSMQALSQSQLHQIATVLQQKHIGGMPKKNVVFDEQTKTRIVYRVVYPEDVDLQQPNSPIEGKDASTVRTIVQPVKSKARGRGRPSKLSRAHLQLSQSENQNPEGEEEEETTKNDRKKVVARTRSGRLSRPPRHMIKDYKRLHHLDFWEPDLDDSDGGYSDYLPAAATATAAAADAGSQPQPANPAADTPGVSAAVPTPADTAHNGKELLNGLTTVKRRISSRFICPTCQKIYLGHARMARHFQLFPDHGSIEEFNQSRREETLKSGESGESAPKKAVDLKRRGPRGRKRTHWNQRTPQEVSEQRKNKLRQMIGSCEPHELVEVVGPLIARTLTLWDLLLLRLESMDRTKGQSDAKPEEGFAEDGTRERADSNRVTWLLMELRALLDSVQSIAGDLLKPRGVSDCAADNVVEIAEQALSSMLGMACGTYVANDEPLHLQRDASPHQAKRLRVEEDTQLPVPDTEDGSEELADLADLDMVQKDDAPKSLSPIKLPDDIPFLNSSDDMICAGDDPDASTDDKRCDDTDSVSGLQAVDDIVNERLKNLQDFSVSLSGPLVAPIPDTPSDLLISDFASDPVTNTSVISATGPESGASSMDLLNYHSLAGDVNASSSSSTGDLASSLATDTNQEILNSYSMALSSLNPYVSLPTNLEGAPASSAAADSFLESLSSLSCGGATVSSFGDSVLKSEPVLPEPPPARRQSPPKFISTFTPAETSDKPAEPITTAQRLQRDYRFSGRSMGLELDGGLDVGLDTDLVFEAFTEELNCNTQN